MSKVPGRNTFQVRGEAPYSVVRLEAATSSYLGECLRRGCKVEKVRIPNDHSVWVAEGALLERHPPRADLSAMSDMQVPLCVKRAQSPLGVW